MDSHLVSVPGVGSLTAWRLSDSDSQGLGWDSDWSLDLIVLLL